ncbi:MAG: TetR/AcrR family transcriptional regulator [Myxococcales bacterium]|nr:TetR/AcrR family transcriptional regulator [Myxococcales bacterium]
MPSKKRPAAKRRLRADAARNRAKILAVAEALLAEQGPSLSTEEVARRAEVGVGTVFRHFPTKENLLVTVIQSRLERLTAQADAIAELPEDSALFAFFAAVIEHTASTPVVLHALTAAGIDSADVQRAAMSEFMAALERLVRRAQDAAVVRKDITVAEVFDLLVALVHVAELRGRGSRSAQIALRVVLDGLGVRGASS